VDTEASLVTAEAERNNENAMYQMKLAESEEVVKVY